MKRQEQARERMSEKSENLKEISENENWINTLAMNDEFLLNQTKTNPLTISCLH